jgi:IS605 OrfB family transposase
VIEDLKVRQMTKIGRGTVEAPGTMIQKQANQNRSLLDVSPRMIRTMLEYKAPWFASRIVVVDPAETSQSCNILRHCRCRKPHQPVPLRLHQLRQHLRCRRQRGEEHPENRHQPNRRTFGDGL